MQPRTFFRARPPASPRTRRILVGIFPAALALACSNNSGTGPQSDSSGSDTTASSSFDTESACFAGAVACPCAAGNLCDPGLVCLSGLCVDLGNSAECGNGNLDADEACDLGLFNSDTGLCKTDCTLQVCGDGFVGPSEACDDGNDNHADECTNGCALPSCGDGIVQSPEECDDKNEDNSDDCLDICLEARCGDGIIHESFETCDDANDIDGDGCESTCVYTVAMTCGDGNTDPEELCFSQTQLLAGKGPGRVIVIDMDGDNFDDLVVPNSDSDDIWLWKGQGDGGFSSPIILPSGGRQPVSAAVLDFDGDGHLDIVTVNRASTDISVHFGTEDFGIFEDPVLDALAPGVTPSSILSANFDGDASGDFAVSLSGGTDGQNAYISLFYGSGNKTAPWIAPNRLDLPILQGGRPFSMAWGDPTNDGKQFLLAADTIESRIHALDWVDKATVHQSPDGIFPLPLASAPREIATGDLNGDGADEIVTALWNQASCDYRADPNACPWNTIAVHYGNPLKSPLIVGKQEYAVQKAPWSPVLTDLNGDGALDIAVANGHSGTISGLLNDGGGTFPSQLVYHFGPSAGTVYVTAADFNGDHQADLILSRRASNTLSILLSNP